MWDRLCESTLFTEHVGHAPLIHHHHSTDGAPPRSPLAKLTPMMTPMGPMGAFWKMGSGDHDEAKGDTIVIFEGLLKRAKETVRWVGERSPGLANDMFLGKHFQIIYDVMKCAAILAEVGEWG